MPGRKGKSRLHQSRTNNLKAKLNRWCNLLGPRPRRSCKYDSIVAISILVFALVLIHHMTLPKGVPNQAITLFIWFSLVKKDVKRGPEMLTVYAFGKKTLFVRRQSQNSLYGPAKWKSSFAIQSSRWENNLKGAIQNSGLIFWRSWMQMEGWPVKKPVLVHETRMYTTIVYMQKAANLGASIA